MAGFDLFDLQRSDYAHIISQHRFLVSDLAHALFQIALPRSAEP
jgi:hypothetical protein